MLGRNGPSRNGDEVLVVPAGRHAADDYYQYSAYICQPNRPFRDVPYIAFYHTGKILRHVPTIRGNVKGVNLGLEGVAELEQRNLSSSLLESATRLLQRLLDDNRKGRREVQFVFLSGPDDPATIDLRGEVMNDKRDKHGRPTAFVQSQRYVSLRRLRAARTTADLEEFSG